MRIFTFLFSIFFLFACKENQNRVEELSANNGANYVKKYFKNNSKVKIEVYDKKSEILLTETEFNKNTITKIVQYYSNKKPKIIAKLLKKPNFYSAKLFLENGKKQSEGSFLYNHETQKLLPVSSWLFFNPKTQEVDSIGNYFSDGKISLFAEVNRVDNKNKKITTIKYFDIKLKDSIDKDSVTWAVKRIR